MLAFAPTTYSVSLGRAASFFAVPFVWTTNEHAANKKRNGWSSFFIETAPHVRNMFISSMAIIYEHSVNGIILPGL
jgi:hypothetical protein